MEHKKILITGASGLVGSTIAGLINPSYTVFAPSHTEMDCTDEISVIRYIESHKPDSIIHCAAFTDNSTAEKERGDKNGFCYQVNVSGTRHIVNAAKRIGAYCIYISTGSVFAGSDENPGPFTEKDPHTDLDDLSWYGATKAMAEDYVSARGSIVRLSHPLATDGQAGIGTDYLHRMITLLSEGHLYPLFDDQLFPISDMSLVATGIVRCIESKLIGTYHMVSTDQVSPYTLCRYAAQSLGLDSSHIKTISFEDFIYMTDLPKRYAKYCGILGVQTSEDLQIPSYSWKDVVDSALKQKKTI